MNLRLHIRIMICLAAVACVAPVPGPARAETSVISGYRSFDTAFAGVFFEEEEVLQRVNRRLKLGRVDLLINWGGLRSPDPVEALTGKVDALFRRVQEILDMRPAGMRTSLIVASDRKEFNRIYRSMYRQDTELIAFFSPARNVIVVDPREVTAHVLAHEMAHAVIHHHYGSVPTPTKVHEILAQYVDTHLQD